MPDLTTRKGMVQVLQDVRHLHRAAKLQDMTDPKQVQQLLDQLLTEAVALRAENEGALGDKAIKELQNVRRSLIAGQIKTGGETEKYLTKVSSVLDQVADVDKERRADKPGVAGYAKKAGKSILSHIPSMDTLIEGLTVANPVLGYGAHILHDVLESRSEEKKERAAERNEKIKGIASSLNGEDNDSQLQKIPSGKGGIGDSPVVITKLDGIKEGVDNLYKVWEPEGGSTQLEKLADTTKDSMEKVSDKLEDANSQLEKIQKDTKESTKNLVAIKEIDKEGAEDQKKKGALARLKDRVGQYKHGLMGKGADILKKGKGFGLLDMLGAGSLLKGIFGEGLIGKIVSGELIAGGIKKVVGFLFGGIFGSLGKAFKIFFSKNMLKFVWEVLKITGKRVPILGLITMAVEGVWGALKGIFNPRETLGLSKDAKITWQDRINAAVSGGLQEILGDINDVLGIFGLNFAKNDSDVKNIVNDSMKQMDDWQNDIYAWINNFFGVDGLSGKSGGVTLKGLTDSAMGYLKTFSDDIWAAFKDTDVYKDGKMVKDAISDFLSNLVKKSLGVFADIGQWFEDAYTNVKNGIKHGIELVKQGADNAGQAVADSAAYILKSLGLSDDTATPMNGVVASTGIVNPSNMLQQAKSTMAETTSNSSSGQKANVIVAPNNVTNVSRTMNVPSMSGARNNDSTYHRVHQRQQFYAGP